MERVSDQSKRSDDITRNHLLFISGIPLECDVMTNRKEKDGIDHKQDLDPRLT